VKKLVVYRTLPKSMLEFLRQRFAVTYMDNVGGDNDPAFAAAVQSAHGLLGASVPIGRSLLAPAQNLEAISTLSVGTDDYDVDYLTQRGIVLTNTPDVLTETTADAIFALILASARRVVELAEFVKAGKWQHSVGPDCYGVDVHGKTLGLVGMGRIGRAVARRGHLGFGMPILYFNRSAAPRAEAELGARRVTLDELLVRSDFVCIVLPLTRDTIKLIGAREFALMKPSAIFINGARGPIVDESALLQALRSGTFYAAGLDVFEREPLSANSPLLTMNNVVALPHIGSATRETRRAMAQLAVDNITAALSGNPQNVVNPAALTRHLAPTAEP
jgi:gluconate 2-dehydrogenase